MKVIVIGEPGIGTLELAARDQKSLYGIIAKEAAEMTKTFAERTRYNPHKEFTKCQLSIHKSAFSKGKSIRVIFKSGKTAIGIIKRCNEDYADVQVNNKEYLVNNKYQVLSQIK